MQGCIVQKYRASGVLTGMPVAIFAKGEAQRFRTDTGTKDERLGAFMVSLAVCAIHQHKMHDCIMQVQPRIVSHRQIQTVPAVAPMEEFEQKYDCLHFRQMLTKENDS